MQFDFIMLCIYLIVSSFLTFIIIFVAFLLSPISYDKKKESAYECGFHPFEDSRSEFDIHYYLVAILFVIFDIELIILLPFVLYFYFFVHFVPFQLIYVFVFLIIIVIGFIYEWYNDILDW